MSAAKINRKATLDCLGLGIIPLDLSFEIDHFPRPEEKVNATGLTIQGGGPVPTCMVGLSRLGCTTAVIAAIGNDLIGQLSMEELKKEGVDTRWLVRKRGVSHLASGLIERDGGRRTFTLYRELVVRPSDLTFNRYPIPRLIHLDGRDIPADIKLSKWGRMIGAQISLDIGSMRNDVSPLLKYVDHLVVADAWALPFTRSRRAERAVTKLQDWCDGIIVVTENTGGSIGCDSGTMVRQRAFKVEAVDTTGAGDVFHAGYLFGVLKGWDLSRRLEFASACAAIKCTRPGCRTAAPTHRQVTRFLKSKPKKYA